MQVATGAAGTTGSTGEDAVERAESLRLIEQEVGVLIRRVRRVIAERARAVHPELQSASYLMLGHLAGQGPMRASALADTFGVDKGAISRQVQHLIDLGLCDRSPDPDDGRATLLSASADAVRRLREVAEDRSRLLDQRLSDWSSEELTELASMLGRYNATLGRD
ncbi:MarR family winged helix-turn-helix transcriptional regulator [Nocardioides sp. SYSU DS0663]|uniref:MarR family winged helix-turn-helix transcriptional regulator n=1 Tax=Nocardioides sp. SYSU DS0663 TaxID=3416445 RepID=UPI003F4C0AAA